MKCPVCQKDDDKVLESRSIDEGEQVRRRRECNACGNRFTSYESVEKRPLMVIKKDERREEFSRQKVLTGILKACEKRPVSMQAIEELVDKVEKEAHRLGKEISSKQVGNVIMEELQLIDEVAYIRFASVYKQFKDANEFVKVVKEVSL
ncbi:transcriptional regulator NrdR [candidate division WOR-1 bacterium RIFOXYA12_FULL_43_27]|uniref:Transcriptional repressor NrdR n=1 Tax=candidate division WOR-1 bacterium RIFOXYC2_FULL_46_14 TaxID=1802587 RepID=A0A1F4U4N2_UNCSA|nr:MAG: transcriptional regulator NrdR [candidate division WOR-1 bacterium RIFOXYA12_FULL_43_27]OGC20756.1 MAG: transcriptional regulator NrdR [candidate division WOR-1 bacterium RIFOXYB2_FULL_46_45]OGC31507.1 MAG: transcriptional regulator NrdR [candidate division WOR-1 bacterium RIFOXYA2_FULL_46_56]OGC39914.1 MAG: transcriptional regulator NrdR [candidate division WOR-1 bacterium RIFOXYC2_FULL_46_14]